MRNIIIFVLFLCSISPFSFSDTIYLRDGTEIRGIIVEEYKDRTVISTEYGESEVMNAEIEKTDYDLQEQNLARLGKKQQEQGNYEKAYYYFERAKKINPEYKEAIDGINHTAGCFFRKRIDEKAQDVERLQIAEDFNRKTREEEKPLLENLRELYGIEIEEDGKNIKVSEVYAGLPADNAGIKRGDIISSIWGLLTGYMSRKEITEILLRPENLEIKLFIDRDVKVTPKMVKSFSFEFKFTGLHLTKLSETSSAYKAGLRNDDLMLAIDGESIRYTPLNDVKRLLRRKPCALTIRREAVIWRGSGRK